MKVLWVYNLLLLCLFNAAGLQTRVPKHDARVLIPQTDLVVIGRPLARKYIAHESMKTSFDTEKYVGELVELAVEEVLLDHVGLDDLLLEQGSTSVRVYVLGRPFGTDREVLFLPNQTYLVFLKRYVAETDTAPPLIVGNRPLKKWDRFPEPSATYFTVVQGGEGLIPHKAAYLDLFEDARRLCDEIKARQEK